MCRNNSLFVLCSIATMLFSSYAADAAEVLQLGTNVVWEAQIVEKALEMPSADMKAWKKCEWKGCNGEKTKPGGTWKRTSFVAPDGWKDSFVRLELWPLQRVDAVVFVNGEKAGEIIRPGGDIELSKFVRPGAANELQIYYTVSGEGTEHGPWTVGEWRQHAMSPGLLAEPRLVVSGGPQIVDVFANTSARKKRIDFEVTVASSAQVEKLKGTSKQKVSVVVRDENGKTVKNISKDIELKNGENIITLGEEWANPHYWEFRAPYLYTAEVTVGGDTRNIRFGFRDIWRDGKEIMMNGHKVRFRMNFAYNGNNRYGAEFLQDMGYNILTYNHNMDPYPSLPSQDIMDAYDEMGMGFICSPGNMGNIAGSHFNKDEKAAEQYRRFQKIFHRMTHNHPSLVACYVTQMIICNIGFTPAGLAQSLGKSDRDDLINTACDINREWNPNILYYSHADGPNGDMSSGNMYLNWTPLQEREEWLSSWKVKGVIPWHGAEFGQPYMGCWYDRRKIYVGSEHLAQYFGDAVYGAEGEDELRQNLLAGANMPSGHGSTIGHAIVQLHPFYRELERLFVWRTNSRWRADGMNGGNLWFNRQGYGSENRGPYQSELNLSKPIERGVKPEWASPAYDAYQLGNKDFCGYIGGFPEHYDKTHAYYSGEKIEKQAVFVWDGGTVSSFTCEASFNGKTTTVSKKVIPGETEFGKVEFVAPDVKTKTDFELVMKFTEGNKVWFTDKMQIEVYPKKSDKINVGNLNVALYDTKGESAGVLDALGIKYTKIDGIDGFLKPATGKKYDALVVGKMAAASLPLSGLEDKIREGLRIIILPQEAETWQAFGLRPMDTVSRILFLRDRKNPLFAGVTDDMLQYWRGAPKYGTRDYGPLMSHTAQRGPRWTRNHAVAALTLEIPASVGYRSVIDGEFDMNYAGVLEFAAGKGKITYCALDFENRVGADPAATEVAKAVFANAFSENADTPKIELVVNDAEKAKAFGFTVSEPTSVWRVAPPESDTFRAIGPSLWRWTDRIDANMLSNPPAGFTVSAGGLVAEGVKDGKRYVFVMVPEGQLAARYKNEESVKLLADEYQNYVLNAAEQMLVALGAPPMGTVIKGREEAEKWRHWNGTWYDVSARSVMDKIKLPSKGAAPHGIRIMGGSKIWTSGCHEVKWEDETGYQKEAESGVNFLIVEPNDYVCKSLGFKTGYACVKKIPATEIGSVKFPELDLSALEGDSMRVLTAVPEGFKMTKDGFFAHGKIANAEVYVMMLNIDKVGNDIKFYKNRNRSCVYAEEHVKRLYARIRTNAGIEPEEKSIKRALYQAGVTSFKPLPAVYVLGPFATGADNDDIIEKVWCEEGEKMAIAGDFNPNIDFPIPQGGTCNWRPTLAPDANGCFDFTALGGKFSNASFPCTYAIATVNRKEDGDALLKFGVDWRARIWVNGEEVFKTFMGAHYPKFEIKLPLKKGDNVITFKIGSGRTGNKFFGLLEGESAGVSHQVSNPELDAMSLYPDMLTPAFDPYEFSFW